MRDHEPARTVAITGASAGVGRAAALAFARRGWAVALLARHRRRLEEAGREVEAAGGRCLVFDVDVSNAVAVEAAADEIAAAWGRMDVWVNNAMVTIFAPIPDVTPEEFRRVTEVTYLGQVHGTLAALKHMRRQRHGTIVQVGSALAYRSIPLQSAYCAAKAASRAFTDSLRTELIHEKSAVRVTMVHLPAVNTPQFEWARSRLPRKLRPVAPIHAPEVAAEAIYRAARLAPREMWVGTPTMKAILGTRVAPGLLDKMMARRAWDGQMTDEPAPQRPDNLFEPVDGGFDAEGRFEAVSRRRALSSSARAVTSAAALVAIAAALGFGALITLGAPFAH